MKQIFCEKLFLLFVIFITIGFNNYEYRSNVILIVESFCGFIYYSCVETVQIGVSCFQICMS